MQQTVHAFDFLSDEQQTPPPVCVAYGDDAFLKRLVLKSVRRLVVGDDSDEIPFATFEGKSVEWRDVMDELSTISLFGGGGPRLVIVEQADDFVSAYRGQLEDYVAEPRRSGVLVLDVGTWPSNTRLYKAIDKNGLQVECRAPEKARGKRKVPDEARMRKWLIDWSKSQHNARLEKEAAELLVELEGNELGLLDQDLAKLALFAGPGGAITAEMVRDVVGGWRTKTIWELLDAAADGDAGDAIRQLDRLLHAGEHPVALFGQISWSLRRFAAATRIYQNAERSGAKIGLPASLEQAGFRKWPREAMENAERQLIQLGRVRAGQMYRWLLEADLALKGSHSQPDRARFVLERLLLRMAKGVT